MYRVIVLNPGSTSTKVALYEGEQRIFSENINHPASDLAVFPNIVDQLPYRKEIITKTLKEKGVDPGEADAFSAICTGLMPMAGGVYEVNEKMYAHGQIGPGSRHPGNLGPLLAKDFAEEFGGRAFIVDASSVDEFEEEARMTGFAELLRTSRGHPLNQRAAARKYASDCGREYEELNLVVAHLGTSDAREVEKRIAEGDKFAELVYRTTAYQIAKDIAAMASVMKGKVDAIILTGGVAYSEMMTGMIGERVSFIAPVKIYPGEFEMDALAAGAIRVLDGKEEPRYYTGEPVFPGFIKETK